MRPSLILVAAAMTAASRIHVGEPSRLASTAGAAMRDTAKTGTYDLEITTDAGTMTGELQLRRQRDSTLVELRAGANKPQVKSFVRSKEVYLLTVGHGGFSIVYTLAFRGDSLSGTLQGSGGMVGTVAGVLKR